MLDESSIRRGMRYSTIEGSFATVFIALSTGAFLTGYALMLGAEEFVIGLIGAIPLITQSMQIFGSHLLKKYKSPQKLAIISSAFNRWIWAFLIFLPFANFNSEIKITIFLLILFISSSAGTILANIWTTWMGEIVPKRLWGKYFGKRTAYNNAVNIVVFFFTATVLDHLKKHSVELGYSIIASICFLSGVVTTLLFKYHPDVHFEFTDRTPLKDELMKPLRDKNFRKFIFFFALWNFSIGFSAPFMSFHMLTNLKVNFSTIAVFNLLTMSLNVLFSQWWGKLIDRFGAKNVLMFNASNIVYIPMFWLFATPNFLLPLYLDAIVTGIAWSGFNLAAFNIPLSKAPKESRSSYIAVLSIFSGFGYFFASMSAGYIATLLKDFSIEIFKLKFVNLHILFFVSLILRMISSIVLARIPEVFERQFFAMVDSISTTILRVFIALGSMIKGDENNSKVHRS